jgi:hypothetical protein
MKSLRILAALSALLVSAGLPIGLDAQTAVYAEFSASKVNAPNNDWIYGPTFGAYFDRFHIPLFSAGLDLRGSVLGPSGSTQLYSGLIGPHVAFRPRVIPVQPYVEGLVGVGHFDFGSGNGSQTNFEYQFLGGIDLTILPRIDWRVAEFSYGNLSAFNGSLNPKTISTGIVLRLP